MFDSGTRVVVLASSHRGPTGVKKGSVGFFLQMQDGHRIYYEQEQKVFTATAEVIFTRYGFEKKVRCEKKKVVVVMPEVDANYSDVSGQVAKLSRRIQSGKNEFWNRCRIMSNISSPKTPVVMLAPAGLNGQRIDDMSAEETCAWMEAVLTNTNMVNWLMSAGQDRYINRSQHPELTEDVAFFLRELASEKTTRMEVSKHAERKASITSIRLAEIVCQRAIMPSEMDFIRHLMLTEKHMKVRNGGQLSKRAISACFYSVLFRPHYLEKIKLTMLGEFGERTKTHFKEPEAVKGCLLVLSACLERTGKIDGKKAMSVGQ